MGGGNLDKSHEISLSGRGVKKSPKLLHVMNGLPFYSWHRVSLILTADGLRISNDCVNYLNFKNCPLISIRLKQHLLSRDTGSLSLWSPNDNSLCVCLRRKWSRWWENEKRGTKKNKKEKSPSLCSLKLEPYNRAKLLRPQAATVARLSPHASRYNTRGCLPSVEEALDPYDVVTGTPSQFISVFIAVTGLEPGIKDNGLLRNLCEWRPCLHFFFFFCLFWFIAWLCLINKY